jgi:UDP-N-acetylmuramoyl-L-alanyl-D-glutamate--2,6-diaminopimelate ligase
VAVSGVRADGAAFVDEAVRRGAVVVVTAGEGDAAVPVVRVPDARAAAADLAAAFHGHPARSLRIAGITGTNGKTTTSFLLHGLLETAGRPSGLLGTVEYRAGARILPAGNTTPGPVELQDLLAQMRDAGCGHAVMEVSSHGLHQGRTRGLDFEVAVFTNLTGDHLDYHGSMEAYRAAKGLLFESLKKDATACIHGSDPAADWFAGRTRARVLRFGAGTNMDIRAENVRPGPDGVRFLLVTPDGSAEVRSPLLGAHNVENLLAAAAAAHGLGLPVDAIAPGLASQSGVPGRLERVDDGVDGFRVLVDYAHTDDALRRVLENLRPITPGRLLVLGGCGGDRDRTKRPRMARAMAEGADEVILTSDNPRTEDPLAILEEMRAGLPPGATAEVIPDRRRAIEALVARARRGDTLLIAGKGHETVQITGHESAPFDDREEARRALRKRSVAPT